MPEYLAPGVYVEETSFRARVIEGVSTSTAGFVGPARFGPVTGEPELLTSFADFERIFGGIEDLEFAAGVQTTNYLARGVQGFFAEGGQRLYVTRVVDTPANGTIDDTLYARVDAQNEGKTVTLKARFPGRAGNVQVTLTLKVGRNALQSGPPPTLSRVRSNDVVFVGTPASSAGLGLVRVAQRDPVTSAWTLVDQAGASQTLAAATSSASTQVRPLTVLVEVARPTTDAFGVDSFGAPELLGEFGLHPSSVPALLDTFSLRPSNRGDFLTTPFAAIPGAGLDPGGLGASLAIALFGTSVLAKAADDTVDPATRRSTFALAGGQDGARPNATAYTGQPALSDLQANPQDAGKNGLVAFEGVPDVSIVAAPDAAGQAAADNQAISLALLAHCERMRYRMAVLDTPAGTLVSGALDYRNFTSSTRAALYYPWLSVLDPLTAKPINLPPSGFVAGVYARNDTEHAVFKAPANEVLFSAVDLETRLNKAQQQALNPEGVNCLRFLPGSGNLVYGARTIADDPEWKYVNVRRYFNYLERSIENGTGWVVFENNSRELWDNVRRSVEDFLLAEWKAGGLLGDSPKQAYFVRCDMSTMTQNDLDNGRLICLIGVAPVKPAEFVIFRIGQWTATG